jgi:hypothetical protein
MVKYVIPGAAGSAEHNATLGNRERVAYGRPRVVIHGEAPGPANDDQHELRRMLARSDWANEAPTIAPSDAKVILWLCKAICAGQGESYLMAARQERSLTRSNPDPNLVAAERFMGGYEGSINEVALGFQMVGKHWRETWLAEKVRQTAPASAWDSAMFAMFFGRNGSPASSASFTTRWGLSGIGHRYMEIKPGSEQSPFQCNCQGVH